MSKNYKKFQIKTFYFLKFDVEKDNKLVYKLY